MGGDRWRCVCSCTVDYCHHEFFPFQLALCGLNNSHRYSVQVRDEDSFFFLHAVDAANGLGSFFVIELLKMPPKKSDPKKDQKKGTESKKPKTVEDKVSAVPDGDARRRRRGR